jgi:hypothetical protein
VYQAKVEPTVELAYNAIALCRFYNGALLIPETGSSGHGQSFTDAVKHDYDRIYQEIRTSRYIDQEKLELGFSTNRASRDPLINSLAAAVGEYRDGAWAVEPTVHIHDARTVEEMRRFEINPRTGKVEAPKGGTDDLVIALALLLVGVRSLGTSKVSTVTKVFGPNDW